MHGLCMSVAVMHTSCTSEVDVMHGSCMGRNTSLTSPVEIASLTGPVFITNCTDQNVIDRLSRTGSVPLCLRSSMVAFVTSLDNSTQSFPLPLLCFAEKLVVHRKSAMQLGTVLPQLWVDWLEVCGIRCHGWNYVMWWVKFSIVGEIRGCGCMCGVVGGVRCSSVKCEQLFALERILPLYYTVMKKPPVLFLILPLTSTRISIHFSLYSTTIKIPH